MRNPRLLTEEETKDIMSLITPDLTTDQLTDLFAEDENGVSPYNPSDFFVLEKGVLGNTKKRHTTIGIYIHNVLLMRHLIEKYPDQFSYKNVEWHMDQIEKFESEMAEKVENDLILPEDMWQFLDMQQRIGGLRSMMLIVPSLTRHMVEPIPNIDKIVDELFEKYAEDVKNNPAIGGAKIEKELVVMAEEYLVNDPDTKDNFLSKAKISIGNNYKMMNLILGPIQNSATGEYNVLKSNLTKGVSKEEYANFGDSAVQGAFARANATQFGGYMSKRFIQTLAHISADERNSDCKTKTYLEIRLPEAIYSKYLGRYIIEDGKLVKLTNENKSKYVGHIVKLRSPMYCKTKGNKRCHMCIGDKAYTTEYTNYGPMIYRLSSSLLNLSLKKFHDLTVKFDEIHKDEYFTYY